MSAILDHALHVLDAEGLDGLSMRSVAAAVGVRHTSLYRHVASREELLVELADHVLEPLVRPPSEGDWRDATCLLAQRFRAVLRTHPALIPVYATTQLLGPNALRMRETGLSLLTAAGMPPRLAVLCYLSVAHFVIGATAFDANGAARTTEERDHMKALFSDLPLEEHPVLREHSDVLNAPDPDEEFEFGLQALISGIEIRWRTS